MSRVSRSWISDDPGGFLYIPIPVLRIYMVLRYFRIDPGIGDPKKLRETGPGSGEAMDIGKPIEPAIPLRSMVDDNRWFNLV